MVSSHAARRLRESSVIFLCMARVVRCARSGCGRLLSLILGFGVAVERTGLLFILGELSRRAGFSVEAFEILALEFEGFAFSGGVHHFFSQVPQFLR